MSSDCGKSLSIPIDNPFRLDIDAALSPIEAFLSSRGAACPADAKSLVSPGFKNFKLAYIGGILEAKARTENGKNIAFKIFPGF